MKKAIKNKSVRLPGHVYPEHYNLTLKPDLESHVFSGTEIITIKLDKSVKERTGQAKDIKILNTKIFSGKEEIKSKSISYDVKSETVTFMFEKIIPAGKKKLSIEFEGILSDNMRGFYKSKYIFDGKERFMATTQFEATDARKAFPCFDEPAHKAIFEVNLIVPLDKTAISNTLPVSISDHSSGCKVVSFAPTPKMSTYLLAFIVGDFEIIETKSKNGVLVRVITVPGKSHQGKFALDVTVKCLEFYEEYFGIPYPLNTLDMIAIPDFSSLAMENWGAITFREIGLLVDELNTSTSTKELIAVVIAHELAHQWFGNLVTMEWWTHLWLNEGFASYIPYLAIDKIFPDWNIWEQFSIDQLAIAFRLDALKNTHPIEVEVHDPNEIGEIFDAVSYDKGASVIRMLAEYLGEKSFRLGLQYYLKKHSYKNASTIHLWEAFEKVSKKPVKKMMAVWTGKSGYPVVSVLNEGKKIKLSQKRFYSSVTSAKKSLDKTVWPIPLSVFTEKGERKISLMEKKNLSIENFDSNWFKLNARDTALFRVKYDDKSLQTLALPVKNKLLLSTDRLSIIRDLFALAESGEIDTSVALSFSKNYKDETDYIVWIEIISGLRIVANILHGSKSYNQFKNFAQSVLENITKKVGFFYKDGESHGDTLLRPVVLSAAVYFENQDVILNAISLFNNRLDTLIPADVHSVVYGAVAKNGGEVEYEKLFLMYNVETLHEEKNRILSALGQFSDKKLIKRTLDFIVSSEVRMQDRNGAFATILMSHSGRKIGWEFLKKNWKKIGEAYGDGNHLLSRLIGTLSRNTTKDAYDDIKSFFKTHSAPSAERTIEQTLERIDSNVKWVSREEKRLSLWLKKAN